LPEGPWSDAAAEILCGTAVAMGLAVYFSKEIRHRILIARQAARTPPPVPDLTLAASRQVKLERLQKMCKRKVKYFFGSFRNSSRNSFSDLALAFRVLNRD